MPMIDSGNNLGELLGLYQMMQQQKARQAQNLLGTAAPGQTVGDLKMDPGTYAALFGKNTPFDQTRVLSPMSDSQRALHAFIGTLTPGQLSDFGASIASASVGSPGMTTAQGALDTAATNASKAGVERKVQTSTEGEQVQTGQNKNKLAAAQSGDILQRTLAGIDAMKGESPDVQKAVNENIAYGTTGSGVQSNELRNRLAITSLQAAIGASKDPNHPLNKFLGKIGLDMPTVLAGSAMGLTNMMNDVVRLSMEQQNIRAQGKNIMTQVTADYAKNLSEKILGGKVTPMQVMAVIDAKQTGKPIPAGLQSVADLMDRATDIYFRAGIADAEEKGDPDARALTQTLTALQSLKDPNQLQAAGQLIRANAAKVKTNQQVGPLNAQNSAVWTKIYQINLNMTQGLDVDHAWYKPTAYNIVGGNDGTPTPSTPGDALPPSILSSLSPTTRAAMVPGKNTPALPFSGPSAQTSGLSPEDAANVNLYLQTIGLSGGAQQQP